MTALVAIAVALAVVGLLGWAVSYNKLITANQQVSDAWAAIDAELERRHSLIPQLVAAVMQSAAHERRLLDELVTARTAAVTAEHSAAERSTPERELHAAAQAVVALRERYPALNTQRNFLQLQHELAITEDRISAARRFYNIKVAEWNRRIQAVPSNIVARRHGMAEAAFFDE